MWEMLLHSLFCFEQTALYQDVLLKVGTHSMTLFNVSPGQNEVVLCLPVCRQCALKRTGHRLTSSTSCSSASRSYDQMLATSYNKHVPLPRSIPLRWQVGLWCCHRRWICVCTLKYETSINRILIE